MSLLVNFALGLIRGESIVTSDFGSSWPLVAILLLSPPHLEQAHGVLEPPHLRLTPIREQEPLACHKAADGLRGQYLATGRLRHDASRQDHRRPEQVLLAVRGLFRDRLTGVQPDANLERNPCRLVALCERPLHGAGALQRLGADENDAMKPSPDVFNSRPP